MQISRNTVNGPKNNN